MLGKASKTRDQCVKLWAINCLIFFGEYGNRLSKQAKSVKIAQQCFGAVTGGLGNCGIVQQQLCKDDRSPVA